MTKSKHLKKSLITALLALLLALLTATVATFAWYIYNTRARTTNVHMAAGAGVYLQISKEYAGPYGSAALLDAFTGTLNPVSTDNILNGFQKVIGFTNGSENRTLIATLFDKSAATDYYMTTLFFRTNGVPQDVYISDISFEDSNESKPISTAIRIGFVAHEPGNDRPADPSRTYIYSINEAENPARQYNTLTGKEGYVLDSTKTDGSTVPLTPYTSANFCNYDKVTGATSLNSDSLPLCTVNGDSGEFGESVQVDVYIWLEGCDSDCTNSLCTQTLKNLALSFAAYPAS